MSAYESQAAHAPLPGAPVATITVPSGSASAATDLNAAMGKWVVLKSSVKTRFRAGADNTTAALVTDYWLTAEIGEPYKVTPEKRWLSAWGDGGAGELVVAMADV